MKQFLYAMLFLCVPLIVHEAVHSATGWVIVKAIDDQTGATVRYYAKQWDRRQEREDIEL